MEMIATSVDNLHKLRELEFQETVKFFPESSATLSLLEIGSGTGYQLNLLKKKFGRVIGIDIPNSNYAEKRVENVVSYDGTNIPFPDDSFDVIFSSNTMEHVIDLDSLEEEMKRVLKPGGICIHIVPSHAWKFWNTLLHYFTLPTHVLSYFTRKKPAQMNSNTGTLRKSKSSIFTLIGNVLFSPLHGERGNRFTEIFYFHPKWWKNHFQKNKWILKSITATGIFYTGHYLSKNADRKKRAKNLGSACYTFVLENPN